jgi:hypothetical protein
MIVLKDTDRLLPLILDGNLLRVGLASANLPAAEVQYYSYSGGDTFSKYGNPGGMYHFQPSNTAPGQAYLYSSGSSGTRVWKASAVEVLESTHFSPEYTKLPSVIKDSSGNIATAHCDYYADMFSPFEYYDASHPAKHDVKMLGEGVSWGVAPDGMRRAIVKNSPSVSGKAWNILKASSWFLLLVNGGQVTFSTKAIKNNIYSSYMDDVTKIGDNQCSQETTVTEMLRSGNIRYYLVKTEGLQYLKQDYPFTGYERFIMGLEYIDHPKLHVLLANGTSIQATSWGTDVWLWQFG